jgi:hypothetical protein
MVGTVISYSTHLALLLVNALTLYRGWKVGLGSALLLAPWMWSGPEGRVTVFFMLVQSLLLGLLADSLRVGPQLRSRLLLQGADLLEAREKLEIVEQANESLRQECSRLGKLQAALAHFQEQVVALHQPEEIRAALLQAVQSEYSARRVAIFRVHDQHLEVVGQRGWAEYPGSIAWSDLPLVTQAFERRTLQSIQHYPLQEPPRNQPAWLWACPLTHLDSGKVFGVLAVEGLPFHRFTASGAAVLQSMCGAASRYLADAEESRQENSASLELLSPADFLRHLRRCSRQLSQGGCGSFCLLCLRPGHESLPLSRALLVLVRCYVRPQDRIGRTNEGDLIVLLNNTRAHQAAPIVELLRENMTLLLPGWVPEILLTQVATGLLEADAGLEAESLLHQLQANLVSLSPPGDLPRKGLVGSYIRELLQQSNARSLQLIQEKVELLLSLGRRD